MDKHNIEYVGSLKKNQLGILFQENQNNNTYVESFLLKINKPLSYEQVKKACDGIVCSHSILRSFIVCKDVNKPLIIYQKSSSMPCDLVEFETDLEVSEAFCREKEQGININKNAIRAVACAVGGKIKYLIIISHHIFIDGWSSSIIIRDFSKALNGELIDNEKPYYEHKEGDDVSKIDIGIYDDYSGNTFLPDVVQGLTLSKELNYEIGTELTHKIKTYCMSQGITKAAFFASVYSIFLSQYNSLKADFGFVVSGRTNLEYQNTVGLFIKTIPFSVDVAGKTIEDINEKVLDLIEKAENGLLPSMHEFTERGFKECNNLLVIENYPLDKSKEDVCNLIDISENTHYKLVMQVLDKENIALRLLTCDGSRDLKAIAEKYCNIIEKVVSCSNNTAAEKIAQNKTIRAIIVAPFETYYLENKLKQSFSCFNINLDLITYGNQELGNVAQEVSSDLIVLYAPYLLTTTALTEAAFSLYYSNIRAIIEKRNSGKIIFVDMGKFASSSVEKDVENEVSLATKDLISVIEQRANASYIDLNAYDNEEIWNRLMHLSTNVPFKESFFDVMQGEVANCYLSKILKPKKLLITDGDNTLWNGTIRNEGIEFVYVDEDKKRFQKKLKKARDEGFLLALCTRNDYQDVKELFEENNEFELSLSDFSFILANDDAKSKNIKRISNELSVGMDSAVFFDDSLYECAEVMKNLPEVLVIPAMGANTELVFEKLFCLKNASINSEDVLRNEVYACEQVRKTVSNEYEDVREFWRSLGTTIEIGHPVSADIPRIVQLSSRTNRFRNSIENIDEESIQNDIENNSSLVLRAKDKFGEYGLISYISWEKSSVLDKNVIINHWYMSCRLSVEYAEYVIFNYMLEFFKKKGFESLHIAADDTGKNIRFVKFIKNISREKDFKNNILSLEQRYEAYDDIPVKFIFVDSLSNISGKNDIYSKVQLRKVEIEDKGAENQAARCSFPDELYKEELIGDSFRYWNYINGERTIEEVAKEVYPLDFWSDLEIVKLKKLWEHHIGESISDYNKSFAALGGKSIKYMELLSCIAQEWNINMYEFPFTIENTLMDHYRFIKDSNEAVQTRLQHIDKLNFDISSFSEKMLIESQKHDDRALHMPFLLKLEPHLSKEDFVRALNEIIEKNRIFKSAIVIEDLNTIFKIQDDYVLDIDEVICDKEPDAKFLEKLLEKFDLSKAPLMHVKHIKCGTGEEYMFLDFCHLIIDGPSILIIAEEIIDVLLGTNRKEVSQFDYFDYISWYDGINDELSKEEALDYWKNELVGLNRAITLPYIKDSLDEKDEVVARKLGKEYLIALEDMAKQNGVTSFALMLMLYAAFLHRLTAEKDISIGIPISCRNNPEIVDKPGMYVNTVIYRSQYLEETIQEYFKLAKGKIINMIKNKDISLQSIMEDIVSEDCSIPFDTMFIYQDYSIEKNGNTLFSEIPVYLNNAQTLLDIRVINMNSNIEIIGNYDNKRLSHSNVCNLVDSFIEFLRHTLLSTEKLDLQISEIPLMPHNQEGMVASFEGDVGASCDYTLLEYFNDAVQKYPEKIAINYKEIELSYAQLNRITDYVAEKLDYSKKVIMVICDNPVLVAISLISILKSGNIYLPVSGKTPKERIFQIIEECNVEKYIASNFNKELPIDYFNIEIEKLISEKQHVKANEIKKSNIKPDDTAYIIFTSGTTGKSKGVAVSHRGVANGVVNRIEALQLGPDYSALQLMGYAFDGFIQTFFSPLLCGATLYLVDDICNYSYIESVLKNHAIRTFLTTPTMYESILALCEKELLSEIKLVSLAGETLDKSLVCLSKELYPDICLVNEYGPTENSIVSTINYDLLAEKEITIGKPILNCKARIVDEFGQRRSIGTVGELYLSGVGLAEGYVNDEELTNERFVVMEDGKRWYRTGDYAYWSDEGEIAFCGRKDSLVKINGYRVDLSEIDRVIAKTKMFDSCHTTFRNEKEIVVYYVAKEFVPMEKVVAEIKNDLEHYMIPSEFYRVSSIPVKDSGKVDLLKLENLIIEENRSTSSATEYAEKLAYHFGKVLSVEHYDISHNFFSAGGNSIKAMVLIDQLNKAFNTDIDVETFRVFNSPLKISNYLLSSHNEQEPISSKIKPFNKFWFINCFYTSVLGVLDYFNVSNIPFINNFKVCSVIGDNGFKIEFNAVDSEEKLLNNLGIDYVCKDITDSFEEEISRIVNENKPIIAHVDCYYLPYCHEKYKKDHHYHVVTIVGYDELRGNFIIIDQQNLQTVSFEYKTIEVDALVTAIKEASVEKQKFHNCDYVVFTGLQTDKRMRNQYDFQWKKVLGYAVDYLKYSKEYDEVSAANIILNFLKMERGIAQKLKDNDTAEKLRKTMGKIQRRVMKIVGENKDKMQTVTLLQILQESIGEELCIYE